MVSTPDTFRTQRESTLAIFRRAETAQDPGICDAFNKAATFIENTPGIVEYFASDRNSAPFTDGMNFRTALHDVVSKAQDFSLRVRAIEAIGNISTRYGDCIQSFYDMQILTRLACNTWNEDVAAATVAAICKIAACPTLRPAPNMNTDQFTRGSLTHELKFRSRMPPHNELGTGRQAAYITYPEVAIAVTAHVLMANESPKARLAAAGNLRAIAWEHRNDSQSGHSDLRSLVVQFVSEHKPGESDPQVLSVLDKIIGLDYCEAEKEKARAIQDLADQLDAQTQAAAKEQRDAVTTVKQAITVSKPLTFKKAAPPPPPKKRWWGLR